MQKVQRNSAISDVFEVQGLRRNRRKGRMPKFSFSHARKFQFPGRVPSPVAGAGLAGMILASCGPPGWWWQPSSIGSVFAEGPRRPRSYCRRSQQTPARARVAQSWLAHRCLQYPFVTRTDERVHAGSLDFRRTRECVEEPGDAPARLGVFDTSAATPWLMPSPTRPRPAGLARAQEHPAHRTPYRAGAGSVRQRPRSELSRRGAPSLSQRDTG